MIRTKMLQTRRMLWIHYRSQEVWQQLKSNLPSIRHQIHSLIYLQPRKACASMKASSSQPQRTKMGFKHFSMKIRWLLLIDLISHHLRGAFLNRTYLVQGQRRLRLIFHRWPQIHTTLKIDMLSFRICRNPIESQRSHPKEVAPCSDIKDMIGQSNQLQLTLYL